MTLLYSLLSSWGSRVCEGGGSLGCQLCICGQGFVSPGEIHVYACHLVACVPDAEPGAADVFFADIK